MRTSAPRPAAAGVTRTSKRTSRSGRPARVLCRRRADAHPAADELHGTRARSLTTLQPVDRRNLAAPDLIERLKDVSPDDFGDVLIRVAVVDEPADDIREGLSGIL